MDIEVELLNDLVAQIAMPNTILLDMRKTSKHWFLRHYDYFLIRKEYTVLDLQGLTCFDIRNPEDNFRDKAFEEILYSVSRYWKYGLEIGSVNVFAWCSQIVEKDSALFHVYDKSGRYKGIYCHSLNWVEDIVYVGQSLGEFFDLDKAQHDLLVPVNASYTLPKKRKQRK